jgi:hypothetical protein
MTPLRGQAAPLYRVYSEREFFASAECQPEFTWPSRKALAGERPARTTRRSAGAAVTAVSLWWVAPVTGLAVLSGAAGVTAAVIASASHGRRTTGADWDGRGPFLAFSSSAVAGRHRALPAARSTRLRLPTWHDHRRPDGRGGRARWLAGSTRSRVRQTRSNATASSESSGSRPPGAPVAQANGTSAPRTPVVSAQYAPVPVSSVGSPKREHADFTFER